MFLGQLIYFEKELNKIVTSSSVSSLLDLDIAGFDKDFLESLRPLTETDILSSLKDKFISNYKNLLKSNELTASLAVWNRVTDYSSAAEEGSDSDPNKNLKFSLFQQTVLEWEAAGSDPKSLHNQIIGLGIFANSDEDFALYYGLHFLDILSQFSKYDFFDDALETENKNDFSGTLSEQKEILVIAPTQLKPLFYSLNIDFIDLNETDILGKSAKSLAINPNIKLVLVDQSVFELSTQIKNLREEEIMISGVNFGDSENASFFDEIVRSTLGVKL